LSICSRTAPPILRWRLTWARNGTGSIAGRYSRRSSGLLVPGNHPLAGKPVVEPQELKGHRFLLRPYCEHAEGCSTLLRENDVDVSRSHELTCDQDVVRLLEAGLGVTVAPQSLRCGESLARAQIGAVGLRRTVYLYAVAGRQRNATATTMMKLLRSADWSRYLN
jgi:DNA-binding transcriptional LysR family regulator